MIVLTDDVAVLPMSKKEDNLSSSPSSSHAAGESTTATSRKKFYRVIVFFVIWNWDGRYHYSTIAAHEGAYTTEFSL